jgi:hypothetical protein
LYFVAQQSFQRPKLKGDCGFSTLELSNIIFGGTSSQRYKRASTFRSRYNNNFQNSIQEEPFAVDIITI